VHLPRLAIAPGDDGALPKLLALLHTVEAAA
jgi:hypothetical protein